MALRTLLTVILFSAFPSIGKRDTVNRQRGLNPSTMNFSRPRAGKRNLNGKRIHVSKYRRFRPACCARDFRCTNACQSEYSLLLGFHAAFSRRPSRRFCCSRSGVRSCRTLRRFLGVRSAEMGHAAGTLLVEEAGGKISIFTGSRTISAVQ